MSVEHFIARQPIFDLKEKVCAYELSAQGYTTISTVMISTTPQPASLPIVFFSSVSMK